MSLTEIFESVENNDIEKIKRAIQTMTVHSLDQVINYKGQSPLKIAVLNNNLALSSILLNYGFNPNQKDNTKLSPFIAAASNGFDQTFHCLSPQAQTPINTIALVEPPFFHQVKKGILKSLKSH